MKRQNQWIGFLLMVILSAGYGCDDSGGSSKPPAKNTPEAESASANTSTSSSTSTSTSPQATNTASATATKDSTNTSPTPPTTPGGSLTPGFGTPTGTPTGTGTPAVAESFEDCGEGIPAVKKGETCPTAKTKIIGVLSIAGGEARSARKALEVNQVQIRIDDKNGEMISVIDTNSAGSFAFDATIPPEKYPLLLTTTIGNVTYASIIVTPATAITANINPITTAIVSALRGNTSITQETLNSTAKTVVIERFGVDAQGQPNVSESLFLQGDFTTSTSVGNLILNAAAANNVNLATAPETPLLANNAFITSLAQGLRSTGTPTVVSQNLQTANVSSLVNTSLTSIISTSGSTTTQVQGLADQVTATAVVQRQTVAQLQSTTSTVSVFSVNLGLDRYLKVGDPLILSPTFGGNEGTVTYAWTVTKSSTGEQIASSTNSQLSFTPNVAGTFQIRVTATRTLNSVVVTAVDTVDIIASSSAPPDLTQVSLPDQTTAVTREVVLDASSAINPNNNGLPLQFNWEFRAKPVGSSASISNATSPFAKFTPDKSGIYFVRLTVKNDTHTVTKSLAITANSSTNMTPMALPGSNRTIRVGQTLILDGSESSDPEQSTLTYKWSVVSVPAGTPAPVIVFNNPNRVTPLVSGFTVPGSYQLQLVVNDGTLDSPAGRIEVTVVPLETNLPPLANAGKNQVVAVGASVVLDGSRSVDPNGDALTYQWSLTFKPTTSTAILTDSTRFNPSFTADVAGTYVINLKAMDGTSSSYDTVVITVVGASQVLPIANAGSDRFAERAIAVVLDGSQSVDPLLQVLSYQWKLLAKPVGSRVTLAQSNTINPSFIPDFKGTYLFELVAFNGIRRSLPERLQVDVVDSEELPSIADAGEDQAVLFGEVNSTSNALLNPTVILDGSRSYHPKGQPITSYEWSLISKPASSAAVAALSGPYARITVDQSGVYVLQLVTLTGSGATLRRSAPDFVKVEARFNALPPVANAGVDQQSAINSKVVLDGRNSYDASGKALSYSWKVVSFPGTTAPTLSLADAVQSNFIPATAGIYVLSLVVSSEGGTSRQDTVVVKAVAADQTLPIANAGVDQTFVKAATASVTVNLNGDQSVDSAGRRLTYQWSVVSGPSTTTIPLSQPSATSVRFQATEPGFYVLQLVVTTTAGSSAPDFVVVHVANTGQLIAPVAVTGPDLFIPLRSGSATALLDGTLTSNPNNINLAHAWSVISKPSGSTVTITNTSTVGQFTFQTNKVGLYVLQLKVMGQLLSLPKTLLIEVTEGNIAPIAEAGESRSVTVGTTVTLSGTATDTEDTPVASLTYSWALISKPTGSTSSLTGSTTKTPSFVPNVVGNYLFELTVSDGTLTSKSDRINIQVNPLPVSNTGATTLLQIGRNLVLDGSRSNSSNGTLQSYTWTYLSGPQAIQFVDSAGISVALSVNGTFPGNKPNLIVPATGVYGFSLVVNDGGANSVAESVFVTVIDASEASSSAPIANAGNDRTVLIGSLVQLDATQSSSPTTALSYLWEILAKPSGSQIALAPNATSVMPVFTPDFIGDYILRLTVRVGSTGTRTDSKEIKVQVVSRTTNLAPVAKAKVDSVANRVITLDGINSYDPNGDRLTYRWNFVFTPPGSTAVLQTPTEPKTSFTFGVADKGTYLVSLMVDDGQKSSVASIIRMVIDNNTAQTASNLQPVVEGPSLILKEKQGISILNLLSINLEQNLQVFDDETTALTYSWSPGFDSSASSNTIAFSSYTESLQTVTVSRGGQTSERKTIVIQAVNPELTSPNLQPIAVASISNRGTGTAGVGSTVILDSSQSYDINRDLLSYEWKFVSIPEGSNPVLSSATAPAPSFVASAPGWYILRLVVSDGKTTSFSSNTAIRIQEGVTALLNPQRTNVVEPATSQNLEGFGWKFVTKPEGSSAFFTTSSTGTSVALDKVGTYIVRSDAGVVFQYIVNNAPEVTVVEKQSVATGDVVTFNASNATDGDNDPIRYSWKLDRRPEGSLASLSSTSAVQSTLTADVEGTYAITLTLSDPFQSKEYHLYVDAGIPAPEGMLFISASSAGVFTVGTGSVDSSGEAPAFQKQLDSPANQVLFNKDFYVSEKPVTADQYKACVTDGACQDRGESYALCKGSAQKTYGIAGRGSHPMNCVSWDDVKTFYEWKNRKDDQFVYRLPTEAEWEYVAKAGRSDGPRYTCGNARSCLNSVAKFIANATSGELTYPVKGFAPNAWNLFDLHGNVQEWTNDSFTPYESSEDGYSHTFSDELIFSAHINRGNTVAADIQTPIFRDSRQSRYVFLASQAPRLIDFERAPDRTVVIVSKDSPITLRPSVTGSTFTITGGTSTTNGTVATFTSEARFTVVESLGGNTLKTISVAAVDPARGGIQSAAAADVLVIPTNRSFFIDSSSFVTTIDFANSDPVTVMKEVELTVPAGATNDIQITGGTFSSNGHLDLTLLEERVYTITMTPYVVGEDGLPTTTPNLTARVVKTIFAVGKASGLHVYDSGYLVFIQDQTSNKSVRGQIYTGDLSTNSSRFMLTDSAIACLIATTPTASCPSWKESTLWGPNRASNAWTLFQAGLNTLKNRPFTTETDFIDALNEEINIGVAVADRYNLNALANRLTKEYVLKNAAREDVYALTRRAFAKPSEGSPMIGFRLVAERKAHRNFAPVAVAGTDQRTFAQTVVALDGSASSDRDGDHLSYTWSILSKPVNSSATLANPAQVLASFTPDLPGGYVIGLTVSDDHESSLTDTIVINVTTPGMVLLTPTIAFHSPTVDFRMGTNDHTEICAAKAIYDAKRVQLEAKLINQTQFNQALAVWSPIEAAAGTSYFLCDSDPAHNVILSQSFYLSNHELTVTEYMACVTATICTNPGKGNFDPSVIGSRGSYPANFLSMSDIQKYLSYKNRLEPGFHYRLPTEAEWEYAARAGSTTKYSCGNNQDCLNQVAVVGMNRVQSKTANAFGLYDMHGNVQEVVSDFFDPNFYATLGNASGPGIDPKGPASEVFVNGAGLGYVIRDSRYLNDGDAGNMRIEARASFGGSVTSSVGVNTPSGGNALVGVRIAASFSAMIAIPASEFVMGHAQSDSDNARPAHTVKLNAFYISDHQVTNAEYDICVQVGECVRRSGSVAQNPVRGVSWRDATAYAAWFSTQNTDFTYRLCTEAEWDFAAKAGRNALYVNQCGNGQKLNGATAAECLVNSGFATEVGGSAAWLSNAFAITPVKSALPNPLGLYDMFTAGEEWVSDWYSSFWYSVTPTNNPVGPTDGTLKVVRGLSHFIPSEAIKVPQGIAPDSSEMPKYLEIGYRQGRAPEETNSTIGFRLCGTKR